MFGKKESVGLNIDAETAGIKLTEKQRKCLHHGHIQISMPDGLEHHHFHCDKCGLAVVHQQVREIKWVWGAYIRKTPVDYDKHGV